MAKKQIGFKTKGMNQDLSVSAFNPEFSFENRNLRLSTNEGNTLLSWVNERGTKQINTNVEIKGTPIGTAVINSQLVIFTHAEDAEEKKDRIYVLKKSEDFNMDCKCLFAGNLSFDLEHPLETLVSYESERIQKVYWVDGKNQPRMINIAASKEKQDKWIDGNPNAFFDFIPVISNNASITIDKKENSGGTFAAGVIQYAFSYANEYGQESNIFAVTPLYYISHSDRAASPEEQVSNSFNITLKNLDTNFDKVVIYSIQRTSIDAAPFAKLLTELSITGEDLTFIDSGSQGSTIDPTELLYKGGKEISALTLCEKDKTLFLGNITEKNLISDNLQDYFTNNRGTIDIQYTNEDKKISHPLATGYYTHTSQLNKNQQDITTFKGGETYRFGFQVQKNTGEWLEPVFLNDKKNGLYPKKISNNLSESNNEIGLVSAFYNLDLSVFTDPDPENQYYVEDFLSKYKKIRPVVVFPSIGDREVICQGALNPTVFNFKDRQINAPYAQSSWFFRPYTINMVNNNPRQTLEYYHYTRIPNITDENDLARAEVYNSTLVYDTPFQAHNTDLPTNSQFFIDQSIVTMHSPDIDFDTQMQSMNLDGAKLRIIGFIPITGSMSAYHISSDSMWPSGYNTQYPASTFGSGETDRGLSFSYTNINEYAGQRMISEYIWNDSWVYIREGGHYAAMKADDNTPLFINYLISPWHKNNSLNNDDRGAEGVSKLIKKQESTTLYSYLSKYISTDDTKTFEHINAKIVLPEMATITNTMLSKQRTDNYDINYYGNYDKLLYKNDGLWVNIEGEYPQPGGDDRNLGPVYDPVQMSYNSTNHVVIVLQADPNAEDQKIPILPFAQYNTEKYGRYTDAYSELDHDGYILGTNEYKKFEQDGIELDSYFGAEGYNFLWLGELYREVENKFGGTTPSALVSNTWLVGGDEVELNSDNIGAVQLKWTVGDAYYQRYDCLKTYNYTEESTNQIFEILSFMCETYTNIEGRYDKWRGVRDSTLVRPTNFNQLNPVYSQRNIFFNYKIIEDSSKEENKVYPNYITYTRTKESSSKTDAWTNITLASVLELDGDKGSISKLTRLDDKVLCFQDSGISQILYNENVQVSTESGVPIEIANSGKVQGKRYLSNTVGCSNKWSVINTPMGIYFVDSNNKDIYRLGGQGLENLSMTGGFNSWCKKKIPVIGRTTDGKKKTWTPDSFDDFVTYYDKQNQDVLFINKEGALAYSEKFSCFTSFYDYGNTPYLCNLDDVGIWIRSNGSLWRHQAGNYGSFFGEKKPYWMTLVANPEPQVSKIFTNLEFRAYCDMQNEGDNQLPFTSLETWNEYQHGITALENKNGIGLFNHGGESSALIKKYRIWRCDIPRDNADPSTDEGLCINRFKKHPNDRMRNPWLYLKLFHQEAGHNQTLDRTEIHDVMMTYFD